MTRARTASALRLALALLPLLGALGAEAAEEKGTLPGIERNFKDAISRVTPATVVCVAKGASKDQPGSSGVIVSKKGLVLSDADASAVLTQGEGGKVSRRDADEVEVRVPDLAKGTFKAYTGKVLRRHREADTCLIRIVDAPSAGFAKFVPMGSSEDVQVGDYAFAMGNSFGLSAEGTPSLTAGVVAALVPLPAGHAQGAHEFIYTTAAVNPGVNGGPLVDLEGRLIGTISTFVLPEKAEPFQFLGKAIPVQRLRAVYGDLPEAAELFPVAKVEKARSADAAALEAAYHAAAQAAYPRVASLLVERREPFAMLAPGPRGPLPVARFQGPVSAVVVDDAGTLVTSLYNLTNTFTLVNPPGVGETVPPPFALETGLAGITGLTAVLSDGTRLSARLVGVHPRAALAVLQADLPKGGTYALPALRVTPPEDWKEGRFALALGNPFGEKPLPSPLLAVGILSKQHAPSASAAWRGWWQTDAGVTDANCGGALVDLRGRLLGLLHVWAPLQHGRSSGIGFVLPWAEVEQAVKQVRSGQVPGRGYLGASFGLDAGSVAIDKLTDGAPGILAGLKAGDRIESVDGRPIPDVQDLIAFLRFHWEGETVRFTVRRDGEKKPLEIPVTLGRRPGDTPFVVPPPPAPDKPAEKPADKPADKPAETPAAPPSDKPPEPPADKPPAAPPTPAPEPPADKPAAPAPPAPPDKPA